MKTEKELNRDILNITMKIQDEHPELSSFIKEMPVRISEPFDQGVNINNLKEYYHSLKELLKNYEESLED